MRSRQSGRERGSAALALLALALWAMPAAAAPLAYVTNGNSNTVSVLDTATNTVVATVPVRRAPGGVAITPDGTLAYVANRADDTVSVLETATNTVVATVPVGRFPANVAVTPDGTFAYVTNLIAQRVSVIATATSTVVATVPVSQAITCDSDVPLNGVEQTITAGGSSLTYDPSTDQYTYVWTTDPSWAGTCRQLIVRLTDNTEHVAHFQFK